MIHRRQRSKKKEKQQQRNEERDQNRGGAPADVDDDDEMICSGEGDATKLYKASLARKVAKEAELQRKVEQDEAAIAVPSAAADATASPPTPTPATILAPPRWWLILQRKAFSIITTDRMSISLFVHRKAIKYANARALRTQL